MDIGISFIVPNEHGCILKRIFRCISANDYLWEVTDEDIFVKNTPYSLCGLYSWGELVEKLPKEESYAVFFMAKAYNTIAEKTDTLEQLMNGSCELALFLFDVTEAELYCKNNKHLMKIASNISREFGTEISIINTKNCTRTNWTEY